MRKLFYPFVTSRSFVRLLLISAFVALASLFAQQAGAQDLLGWDPSCAPDCVGSGGFDATLTCGPSGSLQGGTTLTRTSPSGPDTVLEKGYVKCTFTDTARTANTTPSCGDFCNNLGYFEESATCLATIQVANLSESCDTSTGTLQVTGYCPYKNASGIGFVTVSNGAGEPGNINCSGGGANGQNPTFCTYAGTDPIGNKSGDCLWNLGFGQVQGQMNSPPFRVVPLTQTQCETAFPIDSVYTVPGQVFNFQQRYEGPACTKPFVGLVGTQNQRFAHSDTFNGEQAAFVDFQKQAVKNVAEGQIALHLTADTEYSPNTINSSCTPNKDQGPITLLVLGNNIDPGTNPIDVHVINQDTIKVNGRDIIKALTSPSTDSCDFPDPTTLRCKVLSCEGGISIVNGIGKTATLTMDACIGNRDTDPLSPTFGKCVDTHVVGDVETKKVSP